MSVFQKSFCALAALLLALPALAQGRVTPEVSGVPSLAFAVRYYQSEAEKTLASAPIRYGADGSAEMVGEQVAALYVVAKALANPEEPPFSVSADGTVTGDAERGVSRIVWVSGGNVTSYKHGTHIGEDGQPQGDWVARGNYASALFFEDVSVDCYWPQGTDEPETEQSLYLYLLTFDTRSANVDGDISVVGGELTASKGPAQVAAWGATYVCKLAGIPEGPLTAYAVNVEDETLPSIVYKNFVDAPNPIHAVAPIASVVVNGETVTDPDVVAAALKPGVSSLAQNAATDTESFPNGSLSLGLTPPEALGLTAYELWTATELDGQWQPFAKVAQKVAQEKGLALGDEMRYSRLRIEKEESLEIPLFKGDPTRFYRLRALGSVEESGE